MGFEIDDATMQRTVRRAKTGRQRTGDFDYVHDPDYVIVQRGVLLDWHLRLRQPNNRGVVRSGDALIALGFKRIDTE